MLKETESEAKREHPIRIPKFRLTNRALSKKEITGIHFTLSALVHLDLKKMKSIKARNRIRNIRRQPPKS